MTNHPEKPSFWTSVRTYNSLIIVRLLRIHPALILITALILCLTTAFAEDTEIISKRDPSVVNIGGLSQLLFDRKSNDITIATEIFFKEVASHIGVKQTKLTIYQSTTEMLGAIKTGKLDTVFVNPIDYLDLDPYINPKYRYTLSFGSKTEQRVNLLTDSLDSITHLKLLAGKRLSIPRGYLLGRIFLEVKLAEAGLPAPDEFFSSIHYTNNTNASLLDVFFNKADLAVTSDLAYELAKELNSQVKKKIHILDSSQPYIPFVIGVNKHVPEDTLKDLDEILMRVNKEPRIRQLLALFSANDLIRVKQTQLDVLLKLKQKHKQLLSQENHE